MLRLLLIRDGRVAARDLPVDEFKLAWAESPSAVVWADLESPADDEARAVLEGVFNFHPLTIEDCLVETPNPKIEDYGDYVYFIMHAVGFNRTEQFRTDEIDFFVGKGFLVTYRRGPVKAVSAVLERLERGGLPVRHADRLVLLVLEALVDHYKPALDEVRRDVDGVEEAVLHDDGKGASSRLTERLLEVRKELGAFRRLLRPQRLLLDQLASGRVKAFRAAMLPYVRDLGDDLARMEDQVSSWQDQVMLSFRIFLNRSSSEANAGIRVLTALTALAIPLMLVGTWFAMNFPGMPLLDSGAAYAGALVATAVGTLLMAVWLRRRGLL